MEQRQTGWVVFDANTGERRDAYVYRENEQTGDVVTRRLFDGQGQA